MNRDAVFTRKVIIDCLSTSVGLSIGEIVDLSGLSRPCVTYFLKEFRAARRAHIAAWRAVPIDAERWTRPEPLFVRGKGDDVDKPRALSSSERKQRHFDREARRQEVNAFNLVVSK